MFVIFPNKNIYLHLFTNATHWPLQIFKGGEITHFVIRRLNLNNITPSNISPGLNEPDVGWYWHWLINKLRKLPEVYGRVMLFNESPCRRAIRLRKGQGPEGSRRNPRIPITDSKFESAMKYSYPVQRSNIYKRFVNNLIKPGNIINQLLTIWNLLSRNNLIFTSSRIWSFWKNITWKKKLWQNDLYDLILIFNEIHELSIQVLTVHVK